MTLFRKQERANNNGFNKGRKKIECPVCGEPFTYQSRIRPGNNGETYKSEQKACSTKCYSFLAASRRPDDFALIKSRKHHKIRRTRLLAVEREPYKPTDIFERDRYRCHICGKKVDPRLKSPHPMSAAVDHIIALIDGGPDTKQNVATAHKRCNSKKWTKVSPNGDQLRIY